MKNREAIVKYIVEIPSGREGNLRRALRGMEPRSAPPVRVAQDELGRTAELGWVEQFYDTELIAYIPEIIPWPDLEERTQVGIGRILAGQSSWQFRETQHLNMGEIVEQVRAEHPEIGETGATDPKGGTPPENIAALLGTCAIRRPDLWDLLESVVEIVTGDAVQQHTLELEKATRIMEQVPGMQEALWGSRWEMTLPDDILPGIEDSISDQAHTICRRLSSQENRAILEIWRGDEVEKSGSPDPIEPLFQVTRQNVIDQYNTAFAEREKYPHWKDLPEMEQERIIENCRMAMPRFPGMMIRDAIQDNPPITERAED